MYKETTVSDFQEHYLEYITQVNDEHLEYILTQDGKQVVKVTPVEERAKKNLEPFFFGDMKDTFEIIGDIMEPVEW